jgi:hypothetical protein
MSCTPKKAASPCRCRQWGVGRQGLISVRVERLVSATLFDDGVGEG